MQRLPFIKSMFLFSDGISSDAFWDSPYFSHINFHSRIFGTAWPNIEGNLKITLKLTERNWT